MLAVGSVHSLSLSSCGQSASRAGRASFGNICSPHLPVHVWGGLLCVLAARKCGCMTRLFAAACERVLADTLQSVQWFGNRAPVKVTRHKKPPNLKPEPLNRCAWPWKGSPHLLDCRPPSAPSAKHSLTKPGSGQQSCMPFQTAACSHKRPQQGATQEISQEGGRPLKLGTPPNKKNPP